MPEPIKRQDFLVLVRNSNTALSTARMVRTEGSADGSLTSERSRRVVMGGGIQYSSEPEWCVLTVQGVVRVMWAMEGQGCVDDWGGGVVGVVLTMLGPWLVGCTWTTTGPAQTVVGRCRSCADQNGPLY